MENILAEPTTIDQQFGGRKKVFITQLKERFSVTVSPVLFLSLMLAHSSGTASVHFLSFLRPSVFTPLHTDTSPCLRPKNRCLRSMGQRHDPESHAHSMVSHGQFSSSSARGQSCPLLMSPGQQTQTAREENRSVMMFGDA